MTYPEKLWRAKKDVNNFFSWPPRVLSSPAKNQSSAGEILHVPEGKLIWSWENHMRIQDPTPKLCCFFQHGKNHCCRHSVIVPWGNSKREKRKRN